MDQDKGNNETIKPARQHFPSANQLSTWIPLFPAWFIKITKPTNAPNKLTAGIKNTVTIKQYGENYEANTLGMFKYDGKSIRDTSNSGSTSPYKYQDVLKITDNNTIVLNVLDEENKKQLYSYGPFSSLYSPTYNNWDIYYEMFGELNIKELKAAADKPETQISVGKKGKIESKYGKLDIKSNLPQNLLKKIIRGGNVVIFGYGLSGSGKTWTTVEGSVFKDSNPQYDPSLLELFIKENKEFIEKITFTDIYPYEGTVIDATNISEYKSIDKASANLIQDLKDRIIQIGIIRRRNLRVLATPNNDSSSRSFLQITVELNVDGKTPKLVFFDMPGTENTIHIKLEFLGKEAFIEKNDQSITETAKYNNKVLNVGKLPGTDSKILIDCVSIKSNTIDKDFASQRLEIFKDSYLQSNLDINNAEIFLILRSNFYDWLARKKTRPHARL